MKETTLKFFLSAFSLISTIVETYKEIVLAEIANSKNAIKSPNENED